LIFDHKKPCRFIVLKKEMYPQQYPEIPSAPPSYQADPQRMANYQTSSDERMGNFQQLVDRYESTLFI
jgi:hypothetical protein